MSLLDQMGHPIGNHPGILKPVKTEVRRENGIRTASGKPRLRVTPGMKMREFFKVKEDGTIEAYTPKAVNKNPAMENTFHLGLYKSPTGIFIPRDKRDDQ